MKIYLLTLLSAPLYVYAKLSNIKDAAAWVKKSCTEYPSLCRAIADGYLKEKPRCPDEADAQDCTKLEVALAKHNLMPKYWETFFGLSTGGISSKDEIRNLITANKVFIFSKSYCTYCKKAKSLLNDLKIDYKVLELDQVSNGDDLQKNLKELTRQSTVPNIFINGEQIGGASDLETLSKSGKLEELLNPNPYLPAFAAGIIEKTKESVIDSFLLGKLEPSLKSEPVPETNDENVYYLVGSEFEKVVRQSKKDVFLKVYSDWCGPCTRMAPVFKELAKMFKSDSNILIAQIKGDLNDLPESAGKIYRFPTLRLFKAGTTEVVDYNGERTTEAMSKFINTNRSTPAAKL